MEIKIKSDVSNEEQVAKMIRETVAKFGKIDILVNNAGVARQSDFLNLSIDDFQRTLDTNLYGTFLCSKYAASVTGIELHRISKNLMAQTNDGRYAALIIPGDMKLNYKEAAKALEAKNVSLVPFNEAHKISGYPPGGTPSVGYEKRIDVILDQELMQYETFYCGGGSTMMLLELRRDDVIRINNAKVHKISAVAEAKKQ